MKHSSGVKSENG